MSAAIQTPEVCLAGWEKAGRSSEYSIARIRCGGRSVRMLSRREFSLPVEWASVEEFCDRLGQCGWTPLRYEVGASTWVVAGSRWTSAAEATGEVERASGYRLIKDHEVWRLVWQYVPRASRNRGVAIGVRLTSAPAFRGWHYSHPCWCQRDVIRELVAACKVIPRHCAICGAPQHRAKRSWKTLPVGDRDPLYEGLITARFPLGACSYQELLVCQSPRCWRALSTQWRSQGVWLKKERECLQQGKQLLKKLRRLVKNGLTA